MVDRVDKSVYSRATKCRANARHAIHLNQHFALDEEFRGSLKALLDFRED